MLRKSNGGRGMEPCIGASRERVLLFVCLNFAVLCSPAMGATLEIMKPVCELLPDLSKEAAAFLGIIGLILVMGGIFLEIKGSAVAIAAMKLFLFVGGLVGIIPLAGAAFPALKGLMCGAG